MELNRIYNEDCLETMKRMPDDFVDLVVTSPPYDNLRDYNGYEFNFEKIAQQLYRIIKQGGIIVWVVGDATIKGSETGTSFKQALYFKGLGANLYDTMIYEKNGTPFPTEGRYYNLWEYMFIISKGKPKTINLIKDRLNKWPAGPFGHKTTYNKDGTKRKHKKYSSDLYGVRFNIWKYNVGFHPQNNKNPHPAVFPEKLAKDHIYSWSNENDLIYDPMMGAGTTASAALQLNRNYIGSEISQEYCDIAEKRISIYKSQYKLQLQ